MKIEFVDEIPEPGGYAPYAEFYAALLANPGRWAVWPGPKHNVYSSARQRGFEAVRRGGVAYMRAPVNGGRASD